LSRAAKICWTLTIIYWCGLYILTHTPVAIPVTTVKDKTAHVAAYASLAIALFLSFKLSRRKPTAQTAMLVLGILLVYGAFDELTQIPVGRSGEMADWYADAAGAALACVLMTLLVHD
jgi:VanZ family protein